MDLKLSKSGIGPLRDKLQTFAQPLIKYHVFIITILVLGILMYGVYTVNILLSAPTDENYYSKRLSETAQANFKQDTIQKIENLKDREQDSNLDLPGGRINPFVD